MPKRHRSTAIPQRATRMWGDASSLERLTILALIGLVIWAIIQIAWHYPSTFFPRFADEGIYALDARVPGSLFDQYEKHTVRYAPAKLGYGLPLAASVAIFGPDGAMYLSTIFWALCVLIVGITTFRRFGALPAAICISFLTFSPIFGKYLTDVGPTTEAALGFVLLWVACASPGFWLPGLCIGFIAFVDFKWAVPAALAFVAVELIVDRQVRLRKSVVHIVSAGLVAISVIGLAMLVHWPYAKFLYDYVFPHSGLVGFDPSPVFVYYLAIFGALTAIIAASAAYALPYGRAYVKRLSRTSRQSLWHALLTFGVPVLFYSLFGVLKALRFFAVLLPLLAVVISVGLAGLIHTASDKIRNLRIWIKRPATIAIPLAALLLVSGGSAGPAHHLTLSAGYEEALRQLRAQGAKGGTVSSYNWPAVAYGWPEPFPGAPFAFVGLQRTDRWIALNAALDRATIELRLSLAGGRENPDSTWAYQGNIYRSISDSLFSVPDDFHASDYFLSELAPDGIHVLRRWRSLRSPAGNFLTVFQINTEKLKAYRRP